jgi:thiol-disulfide isomerase/thioredoxin
MSDNRTEEIILDTRDDLANHLSSTNYEFTILKFYADWCKPCKAITPFVNKLIDDKIKELDQKSMKNKFIYIEVDVDECFDLYAFLKKEKMIRGIPAIFLYSKKVYSGEVSNKVHIPQASISGTDEAKIRQLLDFIK